MVHFSVAVGLIGGKKKPLNKQKHPENKSRTILGEAESNAFSNSLLIQSLSISKLFPDLFMFCTFLSHKYSVLFHRHVIALVNYTELRWN